MAQYKADRDMLTTADSGPRNPAVPLFVIHTYEGDPNKTAEEMAAWQLDPANESSYTGVIDRRGVAIRENDDDYTPWSAMPTGNKLGRHWSLAGRASQTRAEWLAQGPQLAKLAEIIAHDHKEYGTDLRHLSVGEVFRARTDWSVRGVCSHNDISKAFKESDHTDPGPNFPYDVVLDMARRIAAGKPPTTGQTKPTKPTKDNDTMTSEQFTVLKEIRDNTREILRQLGQPGGWKQGGNRTLYDLAAAIAEVEGVPNTYDTLG